MRSRSAGSSIGKTISMRRKKLRGIQSALPSEELRRAAVLEIEDARVLEEAPDDAADGDVLAHALRRRAAGSRCRGR